MRGLSNVIQVRIDAAPAANLTANINGVVLTAAATATICSGEEVTFIATAVPNGSYEFFINGGQVRARADSNVYTTTSLIAGDQVTVRVYDRLTAAAPAGCSDDSAAFNILITPVPTLTVTSTALGNEICEDEPVTFFANASIAGATYDFYINSVLEQSSTTQSFDPLGSYGIVIAGGDVIEVRASTGAASCSTAAVSLTIQTNGISTVGTITTATSSVCLGDTAPPLTGSASTGSGTISYQWQSRNQTTSVFSDILGATSQNYTPTTALTTDTFFRRMTISDTGTTTCEAPGNVIQVRIDAAPAANLTANINGVVLTAAATATICSGEEVTFIATAVPNGSYEFFINGGQVRARADSNVYTTTSLIAGDQVTVRVYDRLTAAAPAGCSDDSSAFNILITPVPTLTVTSTALGNEICAGDPVTFFANASIAGATYDFYINSVLEQSSTTQSFDPLGSYGIVIAGGDVIEVRASTGAASCSTAAVSLTIQTNGISTVGTITTATSSVCLGDTAPPLTGSASTGSGTISYQWQSRNQTTSVFSDILGANSQNYTPTTALTTDTFFRRMTISDTGTTTCEAPGNVIQVRIDAPPAANLTANINGVVLTAAATATICSGEEVTFIATAVPNGSYEFFINGGQVRARADSNVYTTTSLIAGDQVTVRVYDRLTAAAPAGCSDDSSAFNILITPVPTLTVTSTALGNEICAGDPVTFFANASIAGATYDFYINSVLEQSSTTQSFDPLGSYGIVIAGGDIIEVRASTGAASCSTAAVSLTIQTNGISTVGTITTATSSVCIGDTAPPLTGSASTGSGTISYQWQSRNQTTSVFSDILGATSQNYTPTTALTTDTFFRRMTISDTGTTTCEAPGNVIQVRIDAAPAANLTANINGVVLTAAATATICSGEEVTFIATAVPNGSYEFFINGGQVRARADSNVYTTTSLIAGDQVTVRVYDRLTAAAPAGCSDDSSAFNILITPVPTLTVTSTALGNEICAGDPVTFFANASIAGATYDFYINSVLEQSSTTQSFDPLGSYGIVIAGGDIIEVRASTGAASCSTAAVSLTIQTNGISTVGTITTATSSVCLGDTAPPLTGSASTGSGTISYQWQSRNQTTSVFSDILGATSQNYTPTTALTTDTFFRRMTISDTGTTTCEAPGNVIQVRIDAAPAANLTANINGVVLTAAATATICSGEEVTFIATAVPNGSYEFFINGGQVRARADSNVYTTTSLIAGDQVTVRVL